jgi:hypothetical protein
VRDKSPHQGAKGIHDEVTSIRFTPANERQLCELDAEGDGKRESRHSMRAVPQQGETNTEWCEQKNVEKRVGRPAITTNHAEMRNPNLGGALRRQREKQNCNHASHDDGKTS